MKHLLSWNKINESKQLKLESIKEQIEDYFLNIMDDPNIKCTSSIKITNYMVKDGERFRYHLEAPAVSGYVEYTWTLNVEGSLDIEDFKYSVGLIDKKIFILRKEEFETKIRYINGVLKQKSLIVISFIWNEPLKLPKEIDDIIQSLKSIGYVKTGTEFISKINLSKEINYKIKTEMPIDFIQNIPNNSKKQIESDFVKLLNGEINKLIDDEIKNIEKYTENNFIDFLTNTHNDTRPLRFDRKVIKIGRYTVLFKIQTSIITNQSTQTPEVYIKSFKINIQRDDY